MVIYSISIYSAFAFMHYFKHLLQGVRWRSRSMILPGFMRIKSTYCSVQAPRLVALWDLSGLSSRRHTKFCWDKPTTICLWWQLWHFYFLSSFRFYVVSLDLVFKFCSSSLTILLWLQAISHTCTISYQIPLLIGSRRFIYVCRCFTLK